MKTREFDKTIEDVSYKQKLDTYKNLSELIRLRSHQELACRKMLIPYFYLLLDIDSRSKYEKAEILWERPQFKGRCDLIIRVSWTNRLGNTEQKEFLWELKSQRMPLFNSKSETMLIPSKGLIEAENQLINYYDDLKNVPEFSNLSLGGIVIGNDDNLATFKDALEDAQKYRLIEDARRIRYEYFYSRCKVELLTWSEILYRIIKVTGKKFTNLVPAQLPTLDTVTDVSEVIGNFLN
ncbi:MAG: hypothetical protein ABIE03_06995 [Patescibacteria group bacterium]|nr:hypothetical protein [Patescibacteria group bacterium]